MSLFVVDSFTGTGGTDYTAHTPELGGSILSNQSGSDALITAAGTIRGNATGGSVFSYPNAAIPSADYGVTARIKVLTNQNGFGIEVRQQPGLGSAYYTFSYAASNGYWNLGGPGLSGLRYVQTLNPGETHVASLWAQGTLLTAFVDGVQVLQHTSSGISLAGAPGFSFIYQDTDTTGYQLDSFAAYGFSEMAFNGRLHVGSAVTGSLIVGEQP